MPSVPLAESASPSRFELRTIPRHRWPLRLMHWLNLGLMLAMVGSGLQILNAHPALYWGETSHFEISLLAFGAAARNGELRLVRRHLKGGVLLVGARFGRDRLSRVRSSRPRALLHRRLTMFQARSRWP